MVKLTKRIIIAFYSLETLISLERTFFQGRCSKQEWMWGIKAVLSFSKSQHKLYSYSESNTQIYGSRECVCSQAGLASHTEGRSCVTQMQSACSHTRVPFAAGVRTLSHWGVWGSVPCIDRADKKRTLEKRRDWGNYTSSPAGRPADDMVIACLAEKCHKEKGEKSGHVSFYFQVLSQVFKSSWSCLHTIYPCAEDGLTPYITMSSSCASGVVSP